MPEFYTRLLLPVFILTLISCAKKSEIAQNLVSQNKTVKSPLDEKADWILGTWIFQKGNARIEQIWTRLNDSTYSNTGIVKNVQLMPDAKFDDHTRLSIRNRKMTISFQSKGRTYTSELIESAQHKLVFHNKNPKDPEMRTYVVSGDSLTETTFNFRAKTDQSFIYRRKNSQ